MNTQQHAVNTQQHDGGPAFPSGKSETPGYENSLPYYEGMSLRDWFAGMALQGIVSSIFCTPEVTFNECAGRAYGMADAMLAARKGVSP